MILRVAIFFGLVSSSAFLSAEERKPVVLPLWPELTGKASANGESIEDRSRNPRRLDRVIRHVTSPELTITWPGNPSDKTPAVVICPGGGYGRVVIDKEGIAIAKWMNEMGFIAAVLKYRLPTPGAGQPAIPYPIQDGQRAIRLLRQNAAEWGIDPHDIGIVGASAGGHLASSVATHFASLPAAADDPLGSISARPDFQVLLYPVISLEDPALVHSGSRKNLLGENPEVETLRFYSNELQVTEDTPPAFLVHAEDDNTVPIANSLHYRDALQSAGVPVRLLILKTGGHGFGLRQIGGESAGWPAAGASWLGKWASQKK